MSLPLKGLDGIGSCGRDWGGEGGYCGSAPGGNLFGQFKWVEVIEAEPADLLPPLGRKARRKVDEVDVLVVGSDVRQLDPSGPGQLARLPGARNVNRRRPAEGRLHAGLFPDLTDRGIVRQFSWLDVSARR